MTDTDVMRGLLQPLDLSEPYQARQKIVVVPDALSTQLRAKLSNEPLDKVNIDWSKLGAGSFPVEAAKTTWKAVKGLLSRGVEVKPVAWTVINEMVSAGKLHLPAGAPTELALYVGNPVSPADYYSAADFHTRLLEHKMSEARELLMSLGAYHFKTFGSRGNQTDTSKRAGVKVPLRSISGERNTSKKGEFTELTEFDLRGSVDPVKPRLAWMPYEPSWRSLVEGRLKYGVTRGVIEVMDHSSYGIDSDLKGTINGVGLKIGGSFSSQRDETFHLVALFPDDEGRKEGEAGRARLAFPKRPRAAKPKAAKAPSMTNRASRAKKTSAKGTPSTKTRAASGQSKSGQSAGPKKK